jgi:MFS family permease
MQQENIKVYGYRWVVLVAFMLIVAMTQVMWITFAPITDLAVKYYGVSDLSIGLLSMIFMIVYIIVSIPASWAIDTWGLRVGVGIGAVLTGVFGLLRGLTGANFTMVLISQIGMAVGQPFVLNAVTTVAARWFPVRERATASGLGSLAIYLGIFVTMVLTPTLVQHNAIPGTLTIYGVATFIAAVVFLVLARERPATPPCPPGQEVRSLVLDGLKQIFRSPAFIELLVVFFVGLGMFNAVTTWIEEVVAPRGFSSAQSGVVGGIMIVGGIVGALVLPTLSDQTHRRVPFIIAALAGTALGLAGLTFSTGYGLLLASSFVLGFSLLSAGPIGFQYGAEITYPTPEGTSNGLMLMMGQISGILFIFGMDSFKSPTTGSMTLPLVVLIALVLVTLVLAFTFHEPAALLTPGVKPAPEGQKASAKKD